MSEWYDYEKTAEEVKEQMESLGNISKLVLDSIIANNNSIPDFAREPVKKIVEEKYL